MSAHDRRANSGRERTIAGRRARAVAPAGAGSSAQARKKRSDFPVPPPRRVKCFSTSETGITVPKPRRAPATMENTPRLEIRPRSGQFAASGSARNCFAEQVDDVIVLQAQLAQLGIELPLDTVRERVRVAEQRLHSKDGLSPLQPPARVFESAKSRPGTARARPDDAARGAMTTSQAKRPATARARLEHGIIAKPMLSPVLSPDDDSDFELLDEDVGTRSLDEALRKVKTNAVEVDIPAASAVPDMPAKDELDKSVASTKKTEDSCISATNNGVRGRDEPLFVGIQTQVEWAHGSLLSWGNPHIVGNATQSIPCEPPKSNFDHQSFKLTLPASRGRTCQPAQTARPPARPSPRTLSSRPVSARSMNSGSKASLVGLSPRTNVRTPMGIWSGPNTPGPGAYHVSEPARKGAAFSKERKLAPTSTEMFLLSTPSPASYKIRRPRDFGWKSLHAVQAWGVGSQFPPSREYLAGRNVPGPKYEIVKPFDLGSVKGFSFGSGPQTPLTPREIEAIKMPGPGQYEVDTPRNKNATHIGSGSLAPRSDSLYVDPKTPGPGAYNMDRALTPRHVKNARCANISRADSATVVDMKMQLEEMKATPSVFEYETTTGVEIGADNAAMRSAPLFSRCSGRELPAAGDPIRELSKVPSSQAYYPTEARAHAGARGYAFSKADRNCMPTGF